MEGGTKLCLFDNKACLFDNKRLLGQFFTTTNPFANEAFVRWFKLIPETPTILEPFAGSNNIVWMIRELGYENDWACFDIQPGDIDENAAKDVPVDLRDTIEDCPKNFVVAITNPPYLAKNSAARRELPYAGGGYDDLYKKALEVMLKNTEYVAAIIPESFITQRLFHERLLSVVSLTCRMFEDTEMPVCLALFVPEAQKTKNDFDIWGGNRRIGSFMDLTTHLISPDLSFSWRFNDPNGLIGLYGVDGNKEASIRFVKGSEIDASDVKESSRSITRISLHGLSSRDADAIIREANKLLKARRVETKDVFMTAFKGLRKDGKYRRRLDFRQARELLDLAYVKAGATGGSGKVPA